MNFEQVMQQMRAQYEEALRGMALPPGVEEHLRERVVAGDAETVLFMLKLAWVFGAQAGHAAAQQTQEVAPPRHRIQA